MSLRLKSMVRLVTDSPTNGQPPRPYVALENIRGGTGSLINESELGESPAEVSGQVAVQPGDVLFGKLRPYLAKSLLVEEPMYASSELMCLRPGANVLPRWFRYVCLSRPFVEWAVATSEGVKMPRTSWDKLAQFRLDLPSIETQHAIADYLDAETSLIDDLIARKEQLSQLLTERLRAEIEVRIGALTGAWPRIPLKFASGRIEVGIVVTPASWYADDGVIALRGVNVEPGTIDLEDVVRLSDEGNRLHAKSVLRGGDVVVVRTGKAGAAAVVPEALDGVNCIDLVIIRRSRKLIPAFLELLVNSDWSQKWIDQYSVGTIQSHFNVGAMKALPLPLPTLDVQRAILDEVSPLQARTDSTLAASRTHVALLLERRQALIAYAVVGGLRVPGAAA